MVLGKWCGNPHKTKKRPHRLVKENFLSGFNITQGRKKCKHIFGKCGMVEREKPPVV
jgi:hypothetical protein